jgi:DNA-binding transcriptional ArsR family regulator
MRKMPLPDTALDALGNPLRREILRQLARSPVSVGALAAEFTVSRPAISRHLAVLQRAGLVAHEQSGTSNIYALEREGFEATRTWLESFWDEAEVRLKRLVERRDD